MVDAVVRQDVPQAVGAAGPQGDRDVSVRDPVGVDAVPGVDDQGDWQVDCLAELDQREDGIALRGVGLALAAVEVDPEGPHLGDVVL